jgi:hypothetical protein
LQSQNRLNELMGLGANTGSNLYGKYARDFSMQDFEADPGAERRRKEAEDALIKSYAARGGLLSGGAGKALIRFNQDYASDEYMNAFNRYQTNRANQLQPLQSMMGAGQTATNQLANASQAYGSGAGSAMQGYGDVGSKIALLGGENQANARLARGGVSAGQYGNYGNLLGAIGGMFK